MCADLNQLRFTSQLTVRDLLLYDPLTESALYWAANGVVIPTILATVGRTVPMKTPGLGPLTACRRQYFWHGYPISSPLPCQVDTTGNSRVQSAKFVPETFAPSLVAQGYVQYVD